MRNNLFLGVAVAALVMPAAAMAQETTSSIRGTVTANGAPVAGATVTVTNTGDRQRQHRPPPARTARSTSPACVRAAPTPSRSPRSGNASVTDINTVVAQAFDAADRAGRSTGADIVVTAASIAGRRHAVAGSGDGPQRREDRRPRLGQPRHPRPVAPRSVRAPRRYADGRPRDLVRRPERALQPLLGRRRRRSPTISASTPTACPAAARRSRSTRSASSRPRSRRMTCARATSRAARSTSCCTRAPTSSTAPASTPIRRTS